MPTNLLLSNKSWNAPESVLATQEGMRIGKSLTIDLSKITADADGNKILTPGTVIIDIGNGYGRTLSRSKLSAASSTGSPTLTVDDTDAFIATDAIVVPVPSAFATLANTWADNDTATVTVAGQSLTYTVSGFSTLAALATAIAAAINADPLMSKLVMALAIDAVLWVYSKTGTNLSFATSESTAGTGTLTASGTVLVSNRALGTIATSGVDTTANTLTLASNASLALPIDMPVGTASPTIAGFVLAPINLNEQSNDVACYIGATLWQNRLPYWDDTLKAALPEIVVL